MGRHKLAKHHQKEHISTYVGKDIYEIVTKEAFYLDYTVSQYIRVLLEHVFKNYNLRKEILSKQRNESAEEEKNQMKIL